MANPEQLAKLNEGVDTWNRWRAENQQATVDLSEAKLAGNDLTGADLQSALLPHANLRGTKLRRGTLLGKADLQQSDICEADLSGADLKGVNFAEADLFDASLRGADLKGADLSSVKGGLRTEQIAGADLSGAKLPEQLKKLYDGLENVKGISESARRIFLAVLAACLYCWLTIATTTDVNLVTNRASSPLPIIQTSIPIVGFYVIAPVLVLCVYFYSHFYLQKLWEELGSLPAVFPDGRPLHTRVDPWLLNDLVRAHFPKLNVNRPFLSYFQLWISVLLTWWTVPITMFLFWGRYLRRHERIGTTFHVILLVIALVAAVRLYQLAVATLRGDERKPLGWKRALTSRRGYLTAVFAVVVGVLFSLVSLGAIQGRRSSHASGIIPLPKLTLASWIRTWVPRSMSLIGYSPFASLKGADISQKKSTWSGRKDTILDLDSVIGAELSSADLRYASAQNGFFADADLSDADLSDADLRGADLRGAHLNGARLLGASLMDAQLRGADLSRAQMAGVRLLRADLREVKSSEADLSRDDLGFTDLSGADLSRANMLWASLPFAKVSRANLSFVNLDGANLGEADLSNTDLSFANLRGARMGHAKLSGADLEGARLTGAILYLCNFLRVKNLSPEAVKHANRWNMAFYDGEILKALGLPRDHNVKLVEEEKRYEESHHWKMAFDEGEILKALGLPPDHNDKLAEQQKKKEHEP